MLRRFVYLSLVLACFWMLPPISVAETADESPQILAAHSTGTTFKRRPDTPDPNEIFALINQARVSAGLPELKADSRLAALAIERADDMAANRYYSHRNKAGKFYYDLLRERNINTGYSCENLDMEFSLSPLPYVTAWLSSSTGHRECLLNSRVTSAGYAVAQLPQANPSDTSTYIVVAIHSTDVNQHYAENNQQ